MNFSILKDRLSSPWLALILITVLAAIIYSNIYHCPFVFDDISSITESAKIRDLGNYFSLEQLLKPRSIVDFTLALNYKFGKLHLFGYHLVNVLIHIINGFLVYFLALTIFRQMSVVPDRRRLKGKGEKGKAPDGISQFSIPMMSLFSALIFIAHPIQAQAVTYTVQRYASMAAMFYMASVLFYLKGRVVAESSRVKAQRIKVEAQSINGIGQRSILSAFSFQLSTLYPSFALY